MQMKGEWRFVAMEYGGLLTVEVGTVLMLQLFANNLDYTRCIPVCA